MPTVNCKNCRSHHNQVGWLQFPFVFCVTKPTSSSDLLVSSTNSGACYGSTFTAYYLLATASGKPWVIVSADDRDFHFNWGWNGGSNGFYSEDDLTTTGIGINHDYSQVAKGGIESDNFPANPDNIRLQSWLAGYNSPADYANPFSVSTKIINNDTTSFGGDFCAQVFDSANNLAGTINTVTGKSLKIGDSMATLTFSSSRMLNLVTGIYSDCIANCTTGSSIWTYVADNRNFINYTNMVFFNNTDIEILEPLSFTNGHELYQWQPDALQAILSNRAFAANDHNHYWAKANFNVNLKEILKNPVDGSVVFTIPGLKHQVIDANHIDTFNFFNALLSVPVRTCQFEISHQFKGTGNYYLTRFITECNPMYVNVLNATSVKQVINTNELTVYPNPVFAELNIAGDGKINMLTIINIMWQKVIMRACNDIKAVEGLSGLS